MFPERVSIGLWIMLHVLSVPNFVFLKNTSRYGSSQVSKVILYRGKLQRNPWSSLLTRTAPSSDMQFHQPFYDV